LDSTRTGTLRGFAWSPDGVWISYSRSISGKVEVVKLRAVPGATPQTLSDAVVRGEAGTQWSPLGDWIAYSAAGGIDLISPDGKSKRSLTSRKLSVYGFSNHGDRVFGVIHHTAGSGDQWQLWETNLNSGVERLLGPIVFPASIDGLAGFSLQPDGNRFLTSTGRFRSHTLLLEGFEQPQPKSWWYRLLHR
jgi:Tol biopolymer transport system component